MFRHVPFAHLQDIDARRICLIKPSALGDVVQTLPLLPALGRRFPGAEIAWVLNRELSGLLEGQPHLSEIIPFDRRGAWRGVLSLLSTLRRRRFDLVFDLQGLLRTGLMTAATGAPVRVGLETAREGAGLACNCVIPDTGRNVPAHARYWRVAEAIGIAGAPAAAAISLSAADRYWAGDQLFGLPRPIIAMHPGARWETKRWPAAKFAEVAARAARGFRASIVVVGSRGEWPLAGEIVERVTAWGGRAVNLAGATSLKQLAAVLGLADVLISNDSGPMHLAAGLGIPVVGVFTCTSPVLSGPRLLGATKPGLLQSGLVQSAFMKSGPVPVRADEPRHELVSTTLPCAASYCRTCPHPDAAHLACLQELSVDRIWNALVRILNRRQFLARSA